MKTNGASGAMHPCSGAKAVLSVASKLLKVLPEEAKAAGIALARQKLRKGFQTPPRENASRTQKSRG